jgi:hypothetical protein
MRAKEGISKSRSAAVSSSTTPQRLEQLPHLKFADALRPVSDIAALRYARIEL